MKERSSRILEVIVLMAVYIGGLVFFRMLNELGKDTLEFDTLSEGMVKLGIVLAGTITGAVMAFIEVQCISSHSTFITFAVCVVTSSDHNYYRY